jgi:ABC-type transporter Mla subunit MlaD
VLAFSKAFTETFGLLVTFVGIGIVVTLIVVYIAVQLHGEHQENEEYRMERQRRFGPS